MKSKNKAIVAAAVFGFALLMMQLEVGGVVMFIIAVMAFFTCALQSIMHLTGYKNGDVFEVYQDSENIEAQALANLTKDKNECQKSRD